MEKKLGVSEARGNFSEIVEKVQYKNDAFIISRHGKPVAAVVPIEVYENWKRQRKQFFEAVRRIQEVNLDADPDEVMRDVLQAQREIRATDK